MNQETYNGILNVLQRGSGVMAQEYCQAFTGVVTELQKRIQVELQAKAAATPATPATPADKGDKA